MTINRMRGIAMAFLKPDFDMQERCNDCGTQ